MNKLIYLFLLGMVIIQASFGQIIKVASVPVITEYEVTDSGGIHNYTSMVENWQRDELYVSYRKGIQVINTKTLSVTATLLAQGPSGMCLDKATGRIVSLSPLSSVYPGAPAELPIIIADPVTKSSQLISIFPPGGTFVHGDVCAFSADGKTLYVGCDVEDYPQSAKLIAVDIATWKAAWTWMDVNQVNAILPLPNGKVYFVTEYSQPYPKLTSDLRVLDLDGQVKKVDLGGLMPTTLNLGPNGHIYASGLEIDPATDEVLNIGGPSPKYISWPWSDSNYAYLAGSSELTFFELAKNRPIAWFDNVKAYGLATKRQADGSDSIAVLSDNRVDFYKYTPVVPKAVITAVTPLYYGVAPVASTQYSPGQVVTVWGEKLCNEVPVVSQVPPLNPLRKELAGCSVRLVDSKGNDLLGSLYFISSNQINVQLPSSAATGIAKLSVKNGETESSPVFLSLKSAKPNYVQYAKAQIGYLAALHNDDGSLVTAEKPLRVGEAIQLYAVGLGETSPIVPAGELAVAPITATVSIDVNGVPAKVLWAGLQGQYAGLYQINLVVPDGSTNAPTVAITVTQTDGTSQTDLFLLEAAR